MDNKQVEPSKNTKADKKKERNLKVKNAAREKAQAEHERIRSNSVSTVQIEETQESAKKTSLFKKTIQVNSNGSCNMKDLIDKIMITLQQEKYVKLLSKNNSVTKCISVLEIIKRKINNELSNLDTKKSAEGHLNEHINLFSQVNEKDKTKKDAVMEIYLSFV